MRAVLPRVMRRDARNARQFCAASSSLVVVNELSTFNSIHCFRSSLQPETSRGMAYNVWRKNAALLRAMNERWRAPETIHFQRPEARYHPVSNGVERLSSHSGERRVCAC